VRVKMNDLIRIGTVTSVNYQEGTVKIIQPDRDNSISFDLPLMSFEYNPPLKGDMVIVVFLPEDSTQGFVIGKPFNANNMPKNGNENIVRKDYDIDSFVEYNKATKTLTVKAENINIIGNVKQQEGET